MIHVNLRSKSKPVINTKQKKSNNLILTTLIIQSKRMEFFTLAIANLSIGAKYLFNNPFDFHYALTQDLCIAITTFSKKYNLLYS